MRKVRLLSALLLCMLAVAACRFGRNKKDTSPLRCAVSTEGAFSGRALLPGYNYELMRRFAASSGRKAEIRLTSGLSQVLDSLRHGKLDVLALPYADSITIESALAADSTLAWCLADSCGIWVFSADSLHDVREAERWFRNYTMEPDYALIRQPFIDLYNPLTRVSADFISPYDSLIRAHADTLGWDWKLLAALIYQESRFRIEAYSPAGAHGLMQLLPKVARKYGCKDRLDPEENIRAGVLLLKALEDKYKDIAADPAELTKFTLAAYNAGTGRMQDCISYARHLGVDVSHWENIAAVIPDMQNDSIAGLDAIQHGTFNGRETISFVRQIAAYHKRYQHICP